MYIYIYIYVFMYVLIYIYTHMYMSIYNIFIYVLLTCIPHFAVFPNDTSISKTAANFRVRRNGTTVVAEAAQQQIKAQRSKEKGHKLLSKLKHVRLEAWALVETTTVPVMTLKLYEDWGYPKHPKLQGWFQGKRGMTGDLFRPTTPTKVSVGHMPLCGVCNWRLTFDTTLFGDSIVLGLS